MRICVVKLDVLRIFAQSKWNAVVLGLNIFSFFNRLFPILFICFRFFFLNVELSHFVLHYLLVIWCLRQFRLHSISSWLIFVLNLTFFWGNILTFNVLNVIRWGNLEKLHDFIGLIDKHLNFMRYGAEFISEFHDNVHLAFQFT